MISFFKIVKVGCPFCLNRESKKINLTYEESEKFYLPVDNFKYQRVKTKIELFYETNWERIYNCTICKTKFYESANDYYKLDNAQIDIIKRWSAAEKKYNSEIEAQIEKIGLTKVGDDYILPCKITTKKNQVFDYVTLRRSKNLPIHQIINSHSSSHFENFFFIDEILKIDFSEFGISKKIRDFSISDNVKEVDKNFYPTIVKTKENLELIFEGLLLFINLENIKGSEVELSNQEWKENNIYKADYITKSKTLLIVKE